jgi:hypothetical protein
MLVYNADVTVHSAVLARSFIAPHQPSSPSPLRNTHHALNITTNCSTPVPSSTGVSLSPPPLSPGLGAEPITVTSPLTSPLRHAFSSKLFTSCEGSVLHWNPEVIPTSAPWVLYCFLALHARLVPISSERPGPRCPVELHKLQYGRETKDGMSIQIGTVSLLVQRQLNAPDPLQHPRTCWRILACIRDAAC